MVPLLLPSSASASKNNETPVGLRLGPRARKILTHLRLAALACRAAARTDIFEACALLSLDGENAKQSYTDTLVKCLGGALNTPIIWLRPGVEELSFDEAWLMRCFEKLASKENPNLNFLLCSRVAPSQRRYIRFLIARISDRFPLD
ncbi:hypothetical protein [Roseobacter sp.]|uniref:hypothetical protein n=1 Tax=Roseobacter sp. TaxID=1907202 RepID=UPI00385ADB6B